MGGPGGRGRKRPFHGGGGGPSGGRKRGRGGGGGGGAEAAKHAVDAAVRNNDVGGALGAYDDAVKKSIALPVHTYNVLLQLCGGGHGNPTGEVLAERADEIFDEMKSKGVAPNEMTYTALARVSGALGDGSKALERVREGVANGIAPKVRSFVPALQAFCHKGQTKEALELEQEMRDRGVAPTEAEYVLLLGALVDAGDAPAVDGLLGRISKELRLLGEPILEQLERWFETDAAAVAAAGDGAQPWVVERTQVNDAGVCITASSISLRAIDLTPEESAELASGIAKLARERENHVDHFDHFVRQLEEDGVYDLLIDGANVGMFNMNFEDASFNFNHIERLLTKLRLDREESDKPPLVVLHTRRTRQYPANKPKNTQLLNKWRARGELYATPPGSNDDWYWLYAAVVAGERGFLVTNDELRDHIFQMLPDPKLFYRWKERHQARFSFPPGAEPKLQYPPCFTTCMQNDPDGKWWMFPSADADEWLLAKRPEVPYTEPPEAAPDVADAQEES